MKIHPIFNTAMHKKGGTVELIIFLRTLLFSPTILQASYPTCIFIHSYNESTVVRNLPIQGHFLDGVGSCLMQNPLDVKKDFCLNLDKFNSFLRIFGGEVTS